MPSLTKAAQKQAQAAEDSFNRTYALQYGSERWSDSLYPALVAPTRYAALVNQFAQVDHVLELLAQRPSPSNGQAAAADLFEQVAFPNINGDVTSDTSCLQAYQFRASPQDTSQLTTEGQFPAPEQASHQNPSLRLMTHWNLDAASLLAVHVLGPKPGDKVLDLCAAPGGKSLAIAQLLRSSSPTLDNNSLGKGCIHSNELDSARNKRLAANLAAYLPSSFFKTGAAKVLKIDATETLAVNILPLGPAGYDKVLVDAPCSSERHIIHSNARAKRSGRVADEMVSWRSGGSKKVAKTQSLILFTALKAVRIGGAVLYATCSLSKDENDGVIERVQQMVEKERKKGSLGWSFEVKTLEPQAQELERDSNFQPKMEDWAEPTAYGWIVLPDHPSKASWGPLYFALLRKTAPH